MSNYSEQAFEALVSSGIQKWRSARLTPELSHGQLYQILGREPVDAPAQGLSRGFDNLEEDLASWPYLEFVHPSRILPHLSLCPKDTLGYLIQWLPQALRSVASEHMDQKALAMPQSRVAQQFIRRTWRLFFDALETAPALFCPRNEGDLEWLELNEQQILQRCLGMSLYAITPCLKDFVDRTSREQMKVALRALPHIMAIPYIRHVRLTLHDLSAELPYHFPIHLWDGSAASLGSLCDKFGFACLGRLLSGKSQGYREEFRQHVSQAVWSLIPQISTPIPSDILSHLKSSFELSQTFENSASRN